MGVFFFCYCYHCRFWTSNITVEDPTKHLRQAAFLGMWDPVQGSSASVLTGGPMTFGTNGFSVLLDVNFFMAPNVE